MSWKRASYIVRACAGGLGIAAVVCGSAAARGAVTYGSASRSVSASSFGGSPDMNSSTVVGPLTLNASSNGTQSSSSASLTADMLTDRITFSGGAGASDTWESSGGGAATGSLGMTVHFTLDSASAYALSGSIVGNPGIFGNEFEKLVRDSDNLTVFSGTGNPSGTLQAGAYTFTINYAAGLNGVGVGSAGVSFNRVFLIPGPGSTAVMGIGMLGCWRRRR